MRPLRVLVQDGGNFAPRPIVGGDGLPANALKDTPLTTAGAGTLLAALLVTGLLLRTGPVAAYADTIDTGANLDAAFPTLAVDGTLDFYYANQIGFACTITAAAGVTLITAAANNVIAANTSRLIHLRKTGVGTYNMYVI